MKEEKSTFSVLNAINVNGHTELKGKLTYLSWAWAWAELKRLYPLAKRTVYETSDGVNYFTDGRTGWVKVGVTVEGHEEIDYLPIMDFKNNSIPLEKITSFDVNKAIQRSTVKAIGLHGLGLYIYAGEDLPEAEEENKLKEALKLVINADSTEVLTAVWGKYTSLHKVEAFKTAVANKGKELKDGKN